MLISAVQSAVCVQRSPAIDWKNAMKQDGDERGSLFHTWVGWMCHFPAERLRGGLGRPRGGAAPRGWASSIGEGEEASRWESVSVSGDAPGLICLRPGGLGSMEQRSLQRGESLCAAAAHWAALSGTERRWAALSSAEQHCAALCSASLERLRLSAICFNPINTLFSRAPRGEVGDGFTV